jgi:hypothetical protein
LLWQGTGLKDGWKKLSAPTTSVIRLRKEYLCKRRALSLIEHDACIDTLSLVECKVGGT